MRVSGFCFGGDGVIYLGFCRGGNRQLYLHRNRNRNAKQGQLCPLPPTPQVPQKPINIPHSSFLK